MATNRTYACSVLSFDWALSVFKNFNAFYVSEHYATWKALLPPELWTQRTLGATLHVRVKLHQILEREFPPPASLLLSVFNWAHSSGVSYVFHRKRKHKQRTVEDVVWEERAELALFPAWPVSQWDKCLPIQSRTWAGTLPWNVLIGCIRG